MPIKKLQLKSGVNRENTRYTTEGGWYDCDKIRFRQGTPEKIGGWVKTSNFTYLGVCRSLSRWSTLEGLIYTGVGTNLKFYIYDGGTGQFNDITPIRATTTLNNPFVTIVGESIVTVNDSITGNIQAGDFVTFSGASSVGGLNLNNEYQIVAVAIDGNSYTINAGIQASSSAIGGGAAVIAAYQINTGTVIAVPQIGWGAGYWGGGTWGNGISTNSALRLWSQSNFGEDLIFGPRGGGIYYWDSSAGFGTRATALQDSPFADNVPTIQNYILVSDINRFVFAFGCNDIGSGSQDVMLIR